MKRMILYISAMAVALAARAAEPEAADTAAVELKGVEIEARMQKATTEGLTYTPSSRQKKAAANGYWLLNNMAIPSLMVSPTEASVTTTLGEDVSLFVNYLPASKDEVDGMRPEDVRRIDVLRSPSDPRFGGALVVVNFIVRPYEYGGYTKLTDQEYSLSFLSNHASVYSKFAHKKWTFDLSLEGEFYHDNHSGSSSEERYELPAGTVTRNEIFTGGNQTSNYFPMGFRAVYSGDGFQISNSAGFQFVRQPRLDADGILDISREDMDGYAYSNTGDRTKRQAWWTGAYYFTLPHDISLNLAPSFNYINNFMGSEYSTSVPGSTAIISDARERDYQSRLTVTALKKFDGKNSLGLDMLGFYQNDKVGYTGTNPAENIFDFGAFAAAPKYFFNSSKFSLTADAGIAAEWTSINGVKKTDVYPYAHLQGSFVPNDKNRLFGYFQYATNSTDLSDRSPNVLRSNELMYRTGNPGLDNYRHITARVSYDWMPSNLFMMNVFAEYYGCIDRIVPVYDLYDGGNAVIRRLENSGNYNSGRLGLQAVLYLINRKLTLVVAPTQHFFRSTGFYNFRHNPMDLRISPTFYAGSFFFQGWFKTAEKSMSESGVWIEGRHSLGVYAGWNNSNWNVLVGAQNILNYDYLSSTNSLSSPVYSCMRQIYTTGSKWTVAFRVSYTISYGKRLDSYDTLKDGSSSSSAILK